MSKKRKGVGKRLRFEVFKRDRFTCQYCGKKAPDVVLECDHIIAVANGGTDDILNLTTSCVDCNSGKSDKPLSENATMDRQREQLAILEERREQLDMMLQWQRSLADLDNETCDKLHQLWCELVPSWYLNETGIRSLKKLLSKYEATVIADSMRKAASQYLIFEGDPPKPTQDSVITAWDYVHRIARFAKTNAQDPNALKLLYIRGIVRNRFHNCKDWVALKLIRRAHELGASLDELTDLAKSTGSWGVWQEEMALLIAERDIDE